MDPLTHFAAPAALVLGFRLRSRDALLAGIGGILPDIEKGAQALYEFVGSDFLLFKHGGTHSILGATLMAAAAAWSMAEERRRCFWLFLIGTLSHLPLDAVSSHSGIAPFLPITPWRAAGLEYLDLPLRVVALLSVTLLTLKRRYSV